MSDRKPRILHLTGDFPDVVNADKTPVIRSLIDLTGDSFDHQVVSLNRASPGTGAMIRGLIASRGAPRLETGWEPFERGVAAIYHAPGKGLFHAAMLRQLGDQLADRLAGGPRPDLVIGHKLTIEGIAVARLSARLGVPYALGLQGHTDARILRYRPDLHGELRRIFHQARMVFPFAPWVLREVEQVLGRRQGPSMLLPCPTELDQALPPVTGGGGLLSMFHLKGHRHKNLRGMVRAMALLEREGFAAGLTIAGGGSAQDTAACQAIARGARSVSFAGPVSRDQVAARMNAASALVQPSLSESFGLVFIEALFAGAPIIYPAGRAVDGYFDDCPFALRVDAKDPRSIAEAMKRAISLEASLKQALAEWQGSDHARQFTRKAIAAVFANGIRTAIRG